MSCDPMTVPEYRVMSDILACVCAQIEADQLPPVCTCTLQPGAVAYDFGMCDHADGMAWVSPISIFPSINFPIPVIDFNPCSNAAGKAIGMQVGLVRSLPLAEAGVDQFVPTSAEEWTAATQLQMLDMNCLRKALTCCTDYDIVLQSWAPDGPAGGVVGGIWSVFVAAD